MKLLKFQPKHLRELDEQDAQRWLSSHVRPEQVALMARLPFSFTGVCEDTGRVLGVAGVREHWEGRAEAFLFAARDLRHEMAAIITTMRKVLKNLPYKRIEAYVQDDFRPGHRLARALRFEHEGRLRAYLPGGIDAASYALIKE